jgi:uncharacterized protein (TIGR03000 family)
MYTAVLLLALTPAQDAVGFGRRHGCCGGGNAGCSGGHAAPAYGGCCGGAGGYSYGGGYAPSGIYAGSYFNGNYYNPNGNGVTQMPTTGARDSFYYEPNQNPNGGMIRVLLPNSDADVWFDNNATKLRGRERVYYPPNLEKDRTYGYTVKARWMENGRPVEQERQVQFRGGQPVTVNFQTNSTERDNAQRPVQNPTQKSVQPDENRSKK